MERLALMPKYEDYVDSGVEWLGDLPSHWDAVKMKFLFKDTSMKNKPNETLLSVTQSQGVVPREWVENRMVMPSGNLESFKFIAKGDFAISLRSFEGGLEYCHHDGIISPAYTVLKTKKDYLLAGYYKYLFKSQTFISELQTSIVGIREGKNISYEELQYSLLPIPAEEEQTRIANFLDKKTALIDEVISIKEQQISLLKERKQIIIQQAVTQGLDPNVPMKDSGVDWIGKVPAHWEVKKMKFIFDSIQTGTTPVTSEPKYFDGDVDWYNPKDLNAGYLDKSEKTISELAIKHGQAKIFPGDSVLIVGIGATCGKTAYLKSSSAFNQQITGFSSRHENAEFMYYLISMYSSVMLKVANYTTLPILNNEFFKHFLLPCPSKIEQDRIVGFLRIETLKFEKTIEIQLQQIERLKEYKTTLINSAVTGKIKITPEMVEQ
ncbi:restriction endonuclease subunit S [Escherichia coli]|nr:restriction endonuclease subunit S [Escherichia coli]